VSDKKPFDWTGRVKSKEDIVKRIACTYPNKKLLIEVECGNGERIKIGRERGFKVYGYSTKKSKFKSLWNFMGIDPYIITGRTLYNTGIPGGMFRDTA
jgi:hypothetical protein